MELEDQLRRSLDALADRVRADLLEQLAPVVAETARSVARERDQAASAAISRLLDATKALDATASLTDIFETLAARAAGEVSRAAAFVLEGARLHAWGISGFGAVADLDIAFADAAVVADALEQGTRIETSDSAHAPEFAALPPGRRGVAIPLAMSGQAFGVLYADEGAETPARNGDWDTLEVLARHAATLIEIMTTRRLAQVSPAGVGRPE